MSDIKINDTDRIVTYTATSGQTVFAIPFEFYESDDIQVQREGIVLTENPSPADPDEYFVTRVPSTGLGSITLGAPGATLSDTVVISSTLPIKRTSNFPGSGIFNISALNTQLNKLTIMVADVARDFARAAVAPFGEAGYTFRPNSEIDGKHLKVSGNTLIGDEAEGAAEGPLGFATARTGTSETLVAADAYKGLLCTNASAITLTVPPTASVNFETGAFIEIYQGGAGAITLTPGSGVTLKSRDNRLTTAGEDAVCALRHVGSDVWRVTGDLA